MLRKLSRLFFWISLDFVEVVAEWSCAGCFVEELDVHADSEFGRGLGIILMRGYSVSFIKNIVWIVLLFFRVAPQEDEITSYSMFPMKSGFCAVEDRKLG